MTFLMVLLAVMAVIIGNLLWLRPSQQERAVAAQRRQAEAAGFRVLLRVAPDWLALPAGERLVAHYHLPLPMPPSQCGRWRWHAGLGNWQPVGHPDAWLAPPPWPVPAPPGWLGADIRGDGVTVYWREDGQPASIDAMVTNIRHLAA